MSAHSTKPLSSSPSRKGPQPASESKSDWLGPIIITVEVVTASAGLVPFPYVKGVVETVKTVLEAVEKVKNNRDTLRELCEDIAGITAIVQDKLSAYGNNVAEEMVRQCKEFDIVLQDVLVVLHKMQKTQSFFKEMLRSRSIIDDIMKYQEKIKKLQSNFMSLTNL
ncbi:hypothetical protein GGX14DRAFT_541442 [Mycena pura]|uniref:Uncharacterized protein n=1 Tax=Mycena pura TaxID=153505 RepID=A0AAD6YJF4_9AGAR|nr:hypothetical protein GGX14DRAFT_541442 [Mycena pura]